MNDERALNEAVVTTYNYLRDFIKNDRDDRSNPVHYYDQDTGLYEIMNISHVQPFAEAINALYMFNRNNALITTLADASTRANRTRSIVARNDDRLTTEASDMLGRISSIQRSLIPLQEEAERLVSQSAPYAQYNRPNVPGGMKLKKSRKSRKTRKNSN